MSTSETSYSIHKGYVLAQRPRDYEVVLDKQGAELRELKAACNAAGVYKALILGPKTKVSLSSLDIYELGEKIGKLGLQIAIVEQHDASKDDVDFLQNVSFNRGGEVRFFTDESSAKAWLEVSE